MAAKTHTSDDGAGRAQGGPGRSRRGLLAGATAGLGVLAAGGGHQAPSPPAPGAPPPHPQGRS